MDHLYAILSRISKKVIPFSELFFTFIENTFQLSTIQYFILKNIFKQLLIKAWNLKKNLKKGWWIHFNDSPGSLSACFLSK